MVVTPKVKFSPVYFKIAFKKKKVASQNLVALSKVAESVSLRVDIKTSDIIL